jgi:hypothetical protein
MCKSLLKMRSQQLGEVVDVSSWVRGSFALELLEDLSLDRLEVLEIDFLILRSHIHQAKPLLSTGSVDHVLDVVGVSSDNVTFVVIVVSLLRIIGVHVTKVGLLIITNVFSSVNSMGMLKHVHDFWSK